MNACRFVAAAGLLVLARGLPAQELPSALQAPFEEGVRALKADKLAEAEAAFLKVLQQPGGKLAFVHNNLGIVYDRRGPASEGGGAVPGGDPRRLQATWPLGSCWARASSPWDERAKPPASWSRRWSSRRASPSRACNWRKAYEHAGNRTGAVDQYRALRELAPKDPEYAYQLGRAYLRVSEWSLGELKRIDPRSARLHQARGHTYRVQGRAEQALRAFELAAEADPGLPEIHLAMAQIYLEQKRLAEARQEVERELRLVPESAGARALEQRIRAEEAKAP